MVDHSLYYFLVLHPLLPELSQIALIVLLVSHLVNPPTGPTLHHVYSARCILLLPKNHYQLDLHYLFSNNLCPAFLIQSALGVQKNHRLRRLG